MWQAVAGRKVTYIIPINDLKDHEGENDQCWCIPWWDENILVHEAMDKRQEFERGRRMS